MKKYLLILLLAPLLYFALPATSHSNTSTTLHSNQLKDDFHRHYLDAISSAEKSVTLLTYSLYDSKIIGALNKKSNEGIPVTVITDAKASKGAEKRLSPHIALTQRFFRGLMHLKLLVVDHRFVTMGSANMTPGSLKRHGNLLLSLDHPPLADWIEQKTRSFTATDRTAKVAHRVFTAKDQTLDFWFFPDNPDGPEQLKSLIRSAKKTIRVAMYTWTRLDLAHELVEAKKRGIDVQIALDASAAASSSKKVEAYLKNSALPIRQNKGKALLHHKFLWIDDETLVLGSANWTKAAFQENDDCFLVITPLTSEQQEQLRSLWEVIDAA